MNQKLSDSRGLTQPNRNPCQPKPIARHRISWAWLLGVVCSFACASLPAAPVIRQGSGANAAALQAIVDQFRADLGGVNNGVGGSFKTGRREINWDGVPNSSSEPNNLPVNFFNATSPRGLILNSIETETGAALNQFAVSATASSGTAVRFGNLNVTYTTNFPTFSAERLFIARNTPNLELTFFVPGTSIPATVSGIGVIFSDVDSATGGNRSLLRCYGADGTQLTAFSSPALDNGLSFAGASFNAGERIARVVIECGNAALSASNNDGVSGVDVVAMDDFIYGEPQPVRMTNANNVVIDTTVPLKFLAMTTTNAPAGFVNATLQCSPHHSYRLFSSTNLVDWSPALVFGASVPDTNLFDPRSTGSAAWSQTTLSAIVQLSREGQPMLFYRAFDQLNNEGALAQFPGP